MGSRSASVPVTHGQEGTVLHVGEDEREAILKTLRASATLNQCQSYYTY
jgi:hypothetical protein